MRAVLKKHRQYTERLPPVNRKRTPPEFALAARRNDSGVLRSVIGRPRSIPEENYAESRRFTRERSDRRGPRGTLTGGGEAEKNGGVDGTRTRDLLRDRQAF
jgi:hypothetical protein